MKAAEEIEAVKKETGFHDMQQKVSGNLYFVCLAYVCVILLNNHNQLNENVTFFNVKQL